MNYKLSICIPTFNRASLLESTLESILKQWEPGVQIVVSDNASSDGTDALMKRKCNETPHLLFSKTERNLGADRNYLRSVEMASGEYCWLFGSDDHMKPGAIRKVLAEIDSSANDLYIANVTLCDREMNQLEDHCIFHHPLQQSYQIANRGERLEYFALAHTTTAFFSFLGSLIFRRNKWINSPIRDEFIGSLWIHVTKIFDMMPEDLRIGYIHEPLLNKRGDNDSFMDLGLVNRYRLAVDGYERIGRFFFGPGSPEVRHIRRTLRNELTIRHLLNAKLECQATGNVEALRVLDEVAATLHQDASFQSRVRNLVYRYTPLPLYSVVKELRKDIRKIRGRG